MDLNGTMLHIMIHFSILLKESCNTHEHYQMVLECVVISSCDILHFQYVFFPLPVTLWSMCRWCRRGEGWWCFRNGQEEGVICKVETYFLCCGILSLSNASRSTLYPASLGYSAIVGVMIHRLAGWTEHAVRLKYESNGMKMGGGD